MKTHALKGWALVGLGTLLISGCATERTREPMVVIPDGQPVPPVVQGDPQPTRTVVTTPPVAVSPAEPAPVESSVVGQKPVVVNEAPPLPRTEVRTSAPGDSYVWVGGFWAHVDARWVWVPGHWEASRPGATWVAGQWEQTPQGWSWTPGHWEQRAVGASEPE